MRRKDREIMDPAEIARVLAECRIVHLGFRDGERVYVVPVNYGYEYGNGKLVLYFHGAQAGLKFELAGTNPLAGFEIDNGGVLGTDEDPCEYTEYFHSIIGSGRVSIVQDTEEKKRILTVLMECQAGKRFEFTDRMVAHVAIYRLDVEEFACKEHDRPM